LSGAARALTLGWSDTPRGRLLVRRGSARAVRALLRARSRGFQPRRVGSALVVAPHPDDETFGCGGAVALLARVGAPLDVAFVTDGAASHPGHPAVAPAAIAARRRAEARQATQVLGVNPQRVWFLDESDGTLAGLEAGEAIRAAARIAGLLARVAPDAILLPCRLDGSSEHEAAFALVARALRDANLSPRILEFPVWSWWNPLRLMRPMLTARRVWRLDLREVLALKARAVACYASQTEPIPPDAAAALPAGFAPMFLCGEEYFFER
jgi:LmbE family N-acetylglucosaminyl deacetylase